MNLYEEEYRVRAARESDAAAIAEEERRGAIRRGETVGQLDRELGPDEGRETYLNLADEASAADFRREDFDADAMQRADAYAEANHLPRFDEVADVDLAADLVWAAEQLRAPAEAGR